MDPRWQRLRLLHRWSFGLWLGWIPFGALVMSLQDRYLPPPKALIVALTYMGAFAITGWVFAFSPCPNCGDAFAFGFRSFFRWQAPWAPRCVHCDARIGDPISKPDVRVRWAACL